MIMRIRNIPSIIAAMLAICGLCSIASGQTEKVGSTQLFTRISSTFQIEVEALGKRVKEKGRERIVYAGEFTSADGKPMPTRLIVQLPRMARLQGFKDQDLAFDGESAKNATTHIDTALLESFLMDTHEGMLASIQDAGSTRLLGRDFGPDPSVKSRDSKPHYDIYDVAMPDLFRKGAPWISRLYYFDSKTHLLQFTQYYDRTVSPPVRIETRFSKWGTIDDSAYPACIERYENGKLVFSFIATSIEAGPAQDVSSYR
jgi:hypothetical protein